jgi:hypothetical protein
MLCLLILPLGIGLVHGQAPDPTGVEDPAVWAGRSRVGFSTSQNPVVERADGSIVIAGQGSHDGTLGTIVLGLSASGEPLWQSIIGKGAQHHQPIGMRALEDGSVLLFGRVYKENRDEGYSPWMGRLDRDGRLSNERRIDGPEVRTAWAFDAAEDGSTVMAGLGSDPDIWVVKTGPNGAVIWSRAFIRSGSELKVYGATCTDDGGVVLTGHLSRDVWVAKLDRDGDIQWSIRAGDSQGADVGWGTVQSDDGGVIVVGQTEAMGADGVLWLLKLDDRGRPQWQSALGGPKTDVPRAVVPDFEGGVWALGRYGTRSDDEGNPSLWIVHVSGDGTVVAETIITDPGLRDSAARARFGISATRDGGAVIAFRSYARGGRLRVLKVDAAGMVARNYPWFEVLESPFRRSNLTVRPAPVESGRFFAQAVEITSDQVEIPFDRLNGWEIDAPPGAPRPREIPVPRPLPPLAGEASDEEQEASESQLLMDGRFKALEKRAKDLLRTQEKNENGRIKLTVFYGDLAVRTEPLLSFGVERSLGQLEFWQRSRPRSVTARVALARAYIDVAWESRGGGFAWKVTDEGWDEFRKNIQAASELLAPLFPDRPEDPMYWSTLLRIAHIGGPAPASTDEILAAGLEIAADFFDLYQTEVMFLRPQWGGGRGEIERFAAQMSDRRAATLGDELYARVAMHLYYAEPADKVFGEHAMKWPRVKSGMELVYERYPSRWNLHMAARLACLAGDREEAHRLLTMEGAEYGDDVAGVWYNAERYDKHRAWAMRRPAGAWVSLPIDEWPPLVLVIEPGENSPDDEGSRLGFVVRQPEGPPLVITAITASVEKRGDPNVTLDLLARPNRVASWEVTSPGRMDGFTNLRLLGSRKPRDVSIDPGLVVARLPDHIENPGVPELPLMSSKDRVRLVLIAGCADGRTECVPQIIEGRVTGGNYDPDSRATAVTVNVDRWGYESVRLGAPVFDEIGRVFGVVVEKSEYAGGYEAELEYQLRCVALERVLEFFDAERAYLVPAQPATANDAVVQATLGLLEEGRWEELQVLAESARDLRTSDGSWVGLGLLDAVSQRSFRPIMGQNRRPDDVIGPILEERVRDEPTDTFAKIAVMSHLSFNGPDWPEGLAWTVAKGKEFQQQWCQRLTGPIARMVEELGDDVYARVVAVRHAALCGDFDETLVALAGLAEVAPNLTPVFEYAVAQNWQQSKWTYEELGAAIDQVEALGGPEVQSTLYGKILRNRLGPNREVDPAVDLDRVASDIETWIDLYPGSSFLESSLLSVLCIKGDTEAAAARIDVMRCSEITMRGTVWSDEICRACFGGDLIPKQER